MPRCEKYVPNREKIHATHRAVAAFFSHEGRLYGIPLPEEDQVKFEAVLTTAGDISSYGYLRDKTIGVLSGQVEDAEDPSAALMREITSELQEILKMPAVFIDDTLLPKCNIGALRKVDNFLVLQATQDDLTKENVPRGVFEVSITVVDVSSEAYSLLKNILYPISGDNEEALRPFVRDLFNRGELVSAIGMSH